MSKCNFFSKFVYITENIHASFEVKGVDDVEELRQERDRDEKKIWKRRRRKKKGTWNMRKR